MTIKSEQPSVMIMRRHHRKPGFWCVESCMTIWTRADFEAEYQRAIRDMQRCPTRNMNEWRVVTMPNAEARNISGRLVSDRELNILDGMTEVVADGAA